MTVDDARQQVEIAVSIFEGNPTDDEALDSLVKAGLAEGDAAAMVQLLPIAFGRVLLQKMGIEQRTANSEHRTANKRISEQRISE